ncbi:MAG: glycosyltransferase family 4 protein [Terriglobia bacterium]
MASGSPSAAKETQIKAQIAGLAVSLAERRVVQDAGPGLRVLVLDEWLHYPPNSGRGVRTWSLLQRLARRHKVSLLCYGDAEAEASVAARAAGISLHLVRPFTAPRGARLYAGLLANIFSRYPYSVWKHYTKRYENRLRELLRDNQFDLVHCECTPYARFLGVVERLPRLIMAHNIESQILFRRAQQSQTIVERVFFGLQARRMEAFEREVLRRADWVTVVTELDAEQVRAWGVQRTSLVENGVDVDQFVPLEGKCDSDEILFLAALDWYPNLDALDYLLKDIFPLVRQASPSARLRIVGRRPPAGLKERIARCPGVEVVGEVADVRPFLTRAAVVVVPLRIGGGSRVKILEALAMGKAVVSTSVGAEGLAVTDGAHLLIADTPSAFAARTVELLGSPDEQRRLGENGRKLVVERYSWDKMAGALEWAWQHACAVRGGGESQVLSADAEAQAEVQ